MDCRVVTLRTGRVWIRGDLSGWFRGSGLGPIQPLGQGNTLNIEIRRLGRGDWVVCRGGDLRLSVIQSVHAVYSKTTERKSQAGTRNTEEKFPVHDEIDRDLRNFRFFLAFHQTK